MSDTYRVPSTYLFHPACECRHGWICVCIYICVDVRVRAYMCVFRCEYMYVHLDTAVCVCMCVQESQLSGSAMHPGKSLAFSHIQRALLGRNLWIRGLPPWSEPPDGFRQPCGGQAALAPQSEGHGRLLVLLAPEIWAAAGRVASGTPAPETLSCSQRSRQTQGGRRLPLPLLPSQSPLAFQGPLGIGPIHNAEAFGAGPHPDFASLFLEMTWGNNSAPCACPHVTPPPSSPP